jgi:hypothetical protein
LTGGSARSRVAADMTPSALFVHRSVGKHMLEDGDVRALIGGVKLDDLDANTNTLTTAAGEQRKSAFDMSSGNTNPDGLAAFFHRVTNDAAAGEELSQYDVVAFKSCYTAAHIGSDEQLAEYRQHYDGPIKDYISAHPSQRFVIISPPPRRRLLTTPAGRRRARAFSVWLAEYSAAPPNAEYFDLYDLLADSGNLLASRFRRFAPYDQHPNEEGSRLAGERLAAALAQAAGRA